MAGDCVQEWCHETLRTGCLVSILFACVLCGLLTQFDARAVAPIRMGTRNCVTEWSFSSAKVYADPFNEVELDVLITAPDGSEQRVPAFWAGEQTWRVRYAPHTTGRFLYRTACSDTNNSGLHGQQGELEVTAYTGDNPLYRHGPVRVGADQRHFAHADGTPVLLAGGHVVDGALPEAQVAGGVSVADGGPRAEGVYGDSTGRRSLSRYARV